MLTLTTPPAIVRPDEPRLPDITAAEALAMNPRMASYAAAADSKGNRDLTQIGLDLKALVARMDAWADEHGDACECDFCYAADDTGGLADDLKGPTWAMTVAANYIEGSVYPLPEKKKRK